jgi:hypothetical protein
MHPFSDRYDTDAIFMARSVWSEKEAIKIGRVRAPPGRGLRVPKRWLAVPNRGVLQYCSQLLDVSWAKVNAE